MVFSADAELSLCAEDKTEKLSDNVFKSDGFRILKSACVLGGNNSGKTCLVKAIKCIRDVILDTAKSFPSNIFSDSKIVSLGVSFYKCGRAFSYDFRYDSARDQRGNKKGFVYECLKELRMEGDANQTEEEIFLIDVERGTYRFKDDGIPEEIMKGFSLKHTLIQEARVETYVAVSEYRDILTAFANDLDIIDSNCVSFKKTLVALRNDTPLKEKVVELIKMADLDIEDFDYVKFKNKDIDVGDGYDDSEEDEDDLKYLELARDHFYSVHRGKPVPSLTFDSVGTGKIVALASYIVDALQSGKTLIIDEFDSGLHFTLTSALVLLFNNVANNKGGQLVFCTHDMTFLDCEHIFRPDQIWFICRDEKKEYLYSLSDLCFSEDDASNESALLDKYRHGRLGIIPNPNFIPLILDGDDT